MYFRYYRRRYIDGKLNIMEVFFSDMSPKQFIENLLKGEEYITGDHKCWFDYKLELIHVIGKEDFESREEFSVPLQEFKFPA